MRFDEAYMGWQEKRLTQEQAAEILGVTDRSFRRYAVRYEVEGLEGLIDRRIEAVSVNGCAKPTVSGDAKKAGMVFAALEPGQGRAQPGEANP